MKSSSKCPITVTDREGFSLDNPSPSRVVHHTTNYMPGSHEKKRTHATAFGALLTSNNNNKSNTFGAGAHSLVYPDAKRFRSQSGGMIDNGVLSRVCRDVSMSIEAGRSNSSSSTEVVETKEETLALSMASDSSNDSMTPGIFTSVTPAWNNRNLKCLSDKVESNLVFAHVRAASPSSITTSVNCHPFAYKKFVSICFYLH